MKNIIRPLLVAAAVASGLLGTASGAHADVRHPAAGSCTVVTTVNQKDGAWYRTYATYCDGLAKPLCLRTFQVITLNRWPYRLSVLVRGTGYYQCPATDIVSRQFRF